MLQTIFNSKLWGKGPKHPVGPSFSGAFERTKDLSGNILRFNAPAPCGDAGMVATDEDNKASLDLYDFTDFVEMSQDYATNFYAGDSLKHQVFLSSWQMNGRPLLDGYMGELRLCINVRYLPNLPANESLFNPEIFAKEVRREMELNFLSEFHNGYNEDEWDFTNTCWPHYMGPLNWQWQDLNSRSWLFYEMQSLRGSSCPYVWNIALTDNHFLECAFYVTKTGATGGNSYCREVEISSEPYLNLMHKIMSTLTLDRTKELEEHEEQVLANNSNTRLLLHPGPSSEQLAFAAHVMWKWSDRDTHNEEEEGVDYRANKEDVAELIKQRIKPNPLPGHIASAVFADDFPAGWMFTDGSRFERGN